ncbi:MAG: hypothetical protein UZ17_ACD001001643 [Acidobacteria bacterium OLB17]|nr:MAG: hypothetical protein UZ17_ACD001001643 [Acidobacteria bacterium OLB17]MCZ2390761.1 DUF1844 domain-containing protein [Acidobacteriota bacterium]
MIGHDDENEKVHFKVADRRKFNADGTLREGVVLDRAPEPKRPEQAPPPQPAAPPAEAHSAHEEPQPGADGIDEDAEIPGAEDPASFVNFLSTLATNAAAALGAMPHPATGKRSLDLESAKYWLDILGMLRDKTKGNLHPQESRLVEGLLADLRMQYVHLVRATEEKLKAQAAAKFSGDEILGKK